MIDLPIKLSLDLIGCNVTPDSWPRLSKCPRKFGSSGMQIVPENKRDSSRRFCTLAARFRVS